MKRETLTLIMLLFTFAGISQKPLATFFTSGGEEFYVILDGKKINPEPQSRVENVSLDNDWAKVKIVFKNEEIFQLKKQYREKMLKEMFRLSPGKYPRTTKENG